MAAMCNKKEWSLTRGTFTVVDHMPAWSKGWSREDGSHKGNYWNPSINRNCIAPISPAKPGSVAQQPNQCITAKSRERCH